MTERQAIREHLEKAMWILKNQEIPPQDKMTPLYEEISKARELI